MAERRRRDREATQERLIEAVGSVLARDGFSALGVNTVAKEAGVDKVLIYRYFGGLPQLLATFGEHGLFWPDDEELVGDDPEALHELEPAERWAILVTNAMRAIRRRPLTHEILAWELVETNELTRILEDSREAQFERLMERFGKDVDPSGPIPAGVVLAIAATNYLVGRARHISVFAGFDLHEDADWKRLEASVPALLDQ